jgi:hypothetical protein
MITHDELHRLARAAYGTDAPDLLRWLETPHPDDLRWYAAWATVLLMGTSDERLTWEAAAQIICLPDASRMGEVLDSVRQTDAQRMADDAEPALLTEADFARIFKAH